jgi:hypothetical protein
MNISDIAITSLETITAFDFASGNYKFTLDELQNATIANTEDKTEITGKGGRKLSNLKRNKAVNISGSNGLVSGGMLEVQTGSKFETKSTEVLWTDYLTVKDGAASTAWKAVGTDGAEIEALYIRNADGTLSDPMEQADAAASGKFTYDPATKALAFHTDVAAGSEIVVYYKRRMVADVLENLSDVYSGKCTLYVDALGEDKCGNIFRIQFFIPKADFSGEFSIELGENQTVHAFEAESLAGACGANASLWTYTIFGVNTEDAA